MLKVLFGSESKVKILSLFLLHSDTKYSPLQISRDLKLSLNSVQRELTNILELGLISESLFQDNKEEIKPEISVKVKIAKKKKQKKEKIVEKKEIKLFEVNKNFILYPELKALFVKAQILSSQKFISSIQKNFKPKLLILTGFFTNYPEAQTDLLIVGQINKPAFIKLISDLENDLGHEINFTILDEEEFKYRQEIMDIFLYNILDGKTIVLIDSYSQK